MVYLARKNGIVITHADKEAMMNMDGVTPEMEITDEEFMAAEGLVRIIDNKIFLGKTDEEKAIDDAQKKIEKIDDQLAKLDKEYLTPRILAGAAKNGEYELCKINEHEALAVPLRAKRREYENILN